MKKILTLIIAIVVPVAIFIFLHSFGENKYNLPFLEEAGSEFFYKDCDSFGVIDGNIQMKNPFCASDSNNAFKAKIFVLNTPEMHDLNVGHWLEYKRVMQYFKDTSTVHFNMLTFFTDSVKMNKSKLNFESWGGTNWSFPFSEINSDSSYHYEMLLRCGLHWPVKIDKKYEEKYKPDVFKAVLVDENCVIRGKYDLKQRKELDRLIIEIQILTSKHAT